MPKARIESFQQDAAMRTEKLYTYDEQDMREYAIAARLADEALMREAMEALRDLLNDTQHKEHANCKDGPCPVREARTALASMRARLGEQE